MEFDDIVYLTLLIFTIVLGLFFKNLRETKLKKWLSTLTGFTIVLFVSGVHTIHPVICILINSFIILCLSKRSCHVISFCFSFLYLIFFRTSTYFGIPYAPNHTNLIMMILTLKVVGLAFEVHDSQKSSENNKNKINPDFMGIVHYSFCYTGVLTGPYYSYKSFSDLYERDFYKYADCDSTALQKLKFVPFFAVIFLCLTYLYPISYVDSHEFYTERSFWYRLFYINPVFITFRMRIYIGLILSECACIMSGLGAYPTVTEPKPGAGPGKEVPKLSSKNLEKLTYNFDTVKNIDVWHTEVDATVRSSIRYWNMCVQYWMAFVIYKRFPFKVFRVGATFAVSAIWHGIYAGYYLCLGVVPFYLFIEDIWVDLFKRIETNKTKKILTFAMWFVRSQAFSYMGMAFSLLTMQRGLRYYGSVYYVYHVTSIFALVSGLILKRINPKHVGAKKD